MSIKASDIKELRERTGAGMLDCRNALAETDGDVEKAIDFLREKGLSNAAKKSSRVAAEGIIDSYIHGGRIGAIVEVNTETDYVAKNEEFLEFVRDVAMQIAAANPKYVSRDEVPEEIVEEEREILKQQALNEGKPEHIVEKMIEGRLNKFFEDICLLDQDFIKDSDLTIQDLLNEKISRIGENIVIRRFERYEVGEGIEVEEEDFAEEVAKQMKG